MNSVGYVLDNVEWDYEGTVSIRRGTGYQGKGVSRTLFLAPKLEDIPEQLFAVKMSQSTDPAKAGKLVFKYFSYRNDPNAKFGNLAPSSVNLNTELSQVKTIVIGGLANMPNLQISLNVALHGSFTNVTCADGLFSIYDENNAEFANPDPNKSGDAPYYIKPDAILRVKLKGAKSPQGNEYLQSTLSTTALSNDVFQATQRGQVWGGSPENNTGNTAAAATVGQAAPGAPVW